MGPLLHYRLSARLSDRGSFDQSELFACMVCDIMAKCKIGYKLVVSNDYNQFRD